MDPIRFEVMGEPVGQGRPRTTVRNGRAIIYKPEKSKVYEALVKAEAVKAMKGEKPTNAPVCLALFVRKSVPSGANKKTRAAMLAGELWPTKKPDLDNVVKAVCDALTGVVWEDDRQIVSLTADQKFSDKPHIVVTVFERQ